MGHAWGNFFWRERFVQKQDKQSQEKTKEDYIQKYLFLKQTAEAEVDLASRTNMQDVGSLEPNISRTVFFKRKVYQEICITNYTI